MDIVDLPQPFGFYRVITGGDELHFGYWTDPEDNFTLPEAQQALTALIFSRLPPAPARILDVGCGLGATAQLLHEKGYEVVAIAPDVNLIEYAKKYHQGPEYIACGFLELSQELVQEDSFDLLLFQESLQYFPDLHSVFIRTKQLLKAQGKLLICDEVSYHPKTREHSAVHLAADIEAIFAQMGFFVRHHQRLGEAVTLTCDWVARGFAENRDYFLSLFGEVIAPEIDRFYHGWLMQGQWYRQHLFGYELWELEPSPYTIRGYISGDEYAILDGFHQAFGVNRSTQHWQWKFLRNPFGGPFIASVWQHTQLVCHYTAYPVPVWLNGRSTLTFQVGDTFTLSAWRGIGRGHSSLLARAVRFFHRQFCENRLPFFYGFNTGTVQKFGQKFLDYQPATEIYDWFLSEPILKKLQKTPRWKNWSKGYTVACVNRVDDWADKILKQSRHHYPVFIERNQVYLKWRYEQHPDFSYRFFVVHRWRKPVGWWITRVEGETLILIDALFSQFDAFALRAGLIAALKFYQQCGQKITQVHGWFSLTPETWTNLLRDIGFEPQRQWQQLDLCLTLFNANQADQQALLKQFYFTAGDSDLF
jgi:SAM-dependent methyltransferase